MTEPSVKTIRGPAVLTLEDGTSWTHERTITAVDDWRDTVFGRVNFGHVLVSPALLVPFIQDETKQDDSPATS